MKVTVLPSYFSGVLHDVAVPQGKVLVLDDDIVGFDVKRQRVLDIVICDLAVGVFVGISGCAG